MSESLYGQALKSMDSTIEVLGNRVPKPQRIPYGSSFVYRYVEKTLHQALVQKLARYVTSLRAAHLLMDHGFVQEQAALQRILDEIQEDISFLAFGAIFGSLTALHQEYLDAFYEEEFDPATMQVTSQARPMMSRKKIRAYIARASGHAQDPSGHIESARTISKTYSGYIHAASPQIMDMYGGNPPHFHVRGMQGTERHDEHREDLWNCFYRGILAFAFAVKAFGEDELFNEISNFADALAKRKGKDYGVMGKGT